jgi:Tol biopolymer transport system component
MPRAVAAVFLSTALLSAGVGRGTAAPSLSPGSDLAVWSPNGEQIAYVTRSGPLSRQHDRVMLMSRSAKTTRVLAQFGRSVYVSGVRFAGNQRLIVALGDQGALCSIDIRTQKVISLGPAIGGVGNGTCEQRTGPLSLGAGDTFTVSATGNRVAYVEDSRYENDNRVQGNGVDDFAIGVVSSLGGPWLTLPEPINASDEQPSFSPDGNELVLVRSLLTAGIASAPSLMLQPVRGGQARPLHTQGIHPMWSPNGRWIAYQNLAHGPASLLPAALEVVSPSGGRSRTMWTPPAHEPLAFSWSPDSTRLAFLTKSGRMGIATLSGKARFFSLRGLVPSLGSSINGFPGVAPQWSPDGKTLLFTVIVDRRHDETRIYAIDANGHDLHPIR